MAEEKRLQITLEAARVNAGLTQKEASNITGLSLYIIKRAEKETEKMPFEVVNCLCKAYGISYDDIFLPRNYPLSEPY